MIRRLLALLAMATLPQSLSAQPVPEGRASFGNSHAPQHMLVRGTTDIDAFDTVLQGFVEANPAIFVEYEQWGSVDLFQMARRDCEQGQAAADLLISSAADLQVWLVNQGCAQPYRSAQTETLPEALNWRSELFGITREPAVMVYNRVLVPPDEVPQTRFDLIDLLRPQGSRYAGRIATYDIEESGLGYLFAFWDSQQATTFGSLVEAFDRSGAIATCCSAEIIDGVIEGRYLIAYNVLGSYAEQMAMETNDLGVVLPSDYALVLSRAAMIPKGAAHPGMAGQLIDFVLSQPGRLALTAEKLISDPVDPEVDERPDQADLVMQPIPLSPVLLVGLDRQKREQFLQLWRATFSAPSRAEGAQ